MSQIVLSTWRAHGGNFGADLPESWYGKWFITVTRHGDVSLIGGPYDVVADAVSDMEWIIEVGARPVREVFHTRLDNALCPLCGTERGFPSDADCPAHQAKYGPAYGDTAARPTAEEK